MIEPKYGNKGTAEPDVFCIYRRTPFFIEVKKSIYSEKQMKVKMNSYLDLFDSRIIENEPLQPVDKKVFPPSSSYQINVMPLMVHTPLELCKQRLSLNFYRP
ncbi:hypothetical protein QF028_000260 [Neobacillus sp. B4I6]|uniref:hypothetical protein n=1 Tax=Neobacillus sp. B4I6 TaxID=3373925 RepID=UPI003D25677E